jgi:hypothetical protein
MFFSKQNKDVLKEFVNLLRKITRPAFKNIKIQSNTACALEILFWHSVHLFLRIVAFLRKILLRLSKNI